MTVDPFAIPGLPIDLSIIIVNWNTRQLLADCLGSIAAHVCGLSYDVWVVDNGSTDGSVELLNTEFPSVRLIQSAVNLGFARANNLAMTQSQGQTMLLLNSDALVTPGAVQALLQVANTSPRTGIVGACLLNPDGSFQASYTNFPTLWREFLILSGLGRQQYGSWYPSHDADEANGPQIVDYVEGACLLVRRSALKEVGGMDEGFFMYAEEVDWCYRMQVHGWQVWYQPQAKIIHLGGASSVNRRTRREADLYQSRVRFVRKHYGDVSAFALKAMIVVFTLAKIATHGVVRFLSGNRRGRPVVSLRELTTALRDA